MISFPLNVWPSRLSVIVSYLGSPKISTDTSCRSDDLTLNPKPTVPPPPCTDSEWSATERSGAVRPDATGGVVTGGVVTGGVVTGGVLPWYVHRRRVDLKTGKSLRCTGEVRGEAARVLDARAARKIDPGDGEREVLVSVDADSGAEDERIGPGAAHISGGIAIIERQRRRCRSPSRPH